LYSDLIRSFGLRPQAGLQFRQDWVGVAKKSLNVDPNLLLQLVTANRLIAAFAFGAEHRRRMRAIAAVVELALSIRPVRRHADVCAAAKTAFDEPT